jgi:tetratricopeptide (TPR) repeat protein
MNGILVVVAMLTLASTAFAQNPSNDPLLDMQAMTRALGVGCGYCHVNMRDEAAPPAPAVGKPKQAIAREMIAMTREINAKVQAAAGKAAPEVTMVTCATCHKGAPIPKPLSTIILQTLRQNGADAAGTQYRELRKEHFGRQTYDFGEIELLLVAERLVQGRPDEAIALAKLNLEFYPDSVRSYIVLGQAFSRKLDDAAAIDAFEQALTIEPNNGVVQGQLIQLRRFQRLK